MKRIILTATVLGLSGLTYAAPGVKKVNKKKLVGCFTQTITQYEDKQGNYVRSVAGPRVAAPCASGQLEGSTTTTYVHTLDPYIDLWP
ncbi:hypothetical protein [Chryseobacterium sp. UNC8MFCol]|uniref:hypothetical protein n=1 Tax=Chryseobacterium sp. UNC8MFCol TaxID=1340435 RepID=UPI0004834901|nr:hypothetical protein [Chryseobacterium sp. UNC8MFCol]